MMPNSVLTYKKGDVVTVKGTNHLYKVLGYDSIASQHFGINHYSLLRIGSKGKCIDSYPVELMDKPKTKPASFSPSSQRELKMVTNEEGLEKFNKAIKKELDESS